jgi:hypothetical protein
LAVSEIVYAKVDGPPDNWHGLRIIDLDTGQEVLDVIEVNAAEGWLISYKRNSAGNFFLDPAKPDEIARQRVEGRFEIRRPS